MKVVTQLNSRWELVVLNPPEPLVLGDETFVEPLLDPPVKMGPKQ